MPGGYEFNRDPAVLEGVRFPEQVQLVDSTIRSLQSGVSGSQHSLADLVDIGVALSGLGVHELIINVSWRDGFETIEQLAKKDLSARLVATFRARNPAWQEWARRSADVGADEICLESSLDSDHLREGAAFVRELGPDVSHGFAEAYELDEVVALSRTGAEIGCRSLAYHDSFFRLGINPEAIRWFIRHILDNVPDAPPLYVHLSNFYGHATMTGVAALSAGATGVDVCMNGTGHHCGHTSLSEVALVLEELYGVPSGIRLEGLREVAQLVEERTKVPVPLLQPIIGPLAFMGDGEYWAAEAHLPYEDRMHATFPFPPETVGSEERVVWNDRTLTTDGVGYRLDALGIEADEEKRAAIVAALREELDRRGTYPAWLTDDEFDALAREVG